jgi:hypothetical protein
MSVNQHSEAAVHGVSNYALCMNVVMCVEFACTTISCSYDPAVGENSHMKWLLHGVILTLRVRIPEIRHLNWQTSTNINALSFLSLMKV